MAVKREDPGRGKRLGPGSGRVETEDVNWGDLFRTARTPLLLLDISLLREELAELRATGVEDMSCWLDAHPEFITRTLDLVRILDASDFAVELAGAADRQELSLSLDRLIVPESLPGVRGIILAVADDHEFFEGEGQFRTLKGNTFHAWIHIGLPPRAANPDLVLLAMTDISWLKKAQEEIRRSEERHRLLVETARDAILCLDMDGAFVFVNQAGLDMAGYTREEVGALTVTDLLPDDLLAENAERHAQRIRGETGLFLYETRYRHKSGREIPIEVSSNLLPGFEGEDGQPLILVVARDITGRKRAEQERMRLEARLRNAQKLESLGVLASGIAHDFNDYLVSIMGNAELIRADQPADSQTALLLEQILAAADRVADLCRQMQSYVGTRPSGADTADISRIVGEISRLLEVSVSGKAQIGYELDGNLPQVRVDVSQIGQVVMNLVTNAVESLGKEGGVVVVRTGSAAFGTRELAGVVGTPGLTPGRYVFCEVRDSGCGMDPETVARIFEPFFTTKFVGRGVGLFAALGIIQSHGGGFLLDSRPGQGTVFSFLLPPVEEIPVADRGISRGKRAPDRSADVLHGRTVLIVDDEANVREVGEGLLRRLGCKVLVAGDGFDAVRIFGQRHQDIDVVIMDLAMVGMDGATAARRLRVIRPDIPVVMTSGFTEARVREEGAGAEPFTFLAKPFPLARLRATLSGILGSE